MKKTKLYVTLLLMLSYIAAAAQTISMEDARNKAYQLFRGSGAFAKTSTRPEAPSLAYTGTDGGNICFYIFNNPSGGFAIIGGDETAREVIGYSTEGTFDETNMPENLRDMLKSYERQIAAGIKTKAKAANAKAAKSSIEPLIKTKWGQDYPYNSMLPTLGSNYAPLITGCNATAASQIMKYYKHAVGNGSHSYQIKYNTGTGDILVTFEANFASTTYDFSNMLDNYNGTYNNDQVKAVGTLLYHAGVAMDMDYGQRASSSITQAPGIALAKNFGYDKSIALYDRKFFTDEEWEEMIYAELAAKRPIIYSGESKTGGHAFIVHGYNASDDTYSVNWGWKGAYDGYFALTGSKALNTGSENGQYSSNHAAIVNIKPNEGGAQSVYFSVTGEVKMSPTNSISNAVSNYELNKGSEGDKNLYLFATLENSGLFNAKVEYGVAFRNTITGELIYTGKYNTAELEPGYYFTDYFRIPFSTMLLTKNGTYEVVPSFRPAGSTSDADWKPMGVDRSTTIPTITIVNASGGEKVDINFSISETNIFTGKTAKISAPSTYNGTLTYSTSNSNVATVSNDGTVTGVAPGTAKITVEGTGTEFYNAGSKTFDITVADKPISYNRYLSMVENVDGGKTYFSLKNNGTGSIYITKLVIKNKNDYTIRGTYKDEDYSGYFGTLNGGATSTNISINVTTPIVYNWYYIYNGNSFVYCSDSNDPSYEPDDIKQVASITLSNTTKTVKVGETFTLTASIAPADATDKTIEWSSSNTAIAIVDANGKVTAKAVGSATITAKAKDGSNVSASCQVTVEKTPVTNITLSTTSKTMKVGDTFDLKATVTPADATNKEVEWSSSNTAVATVDANGKVTAKAVGSATITAKAKDGSNVSASCQVTVEKTSVTNITLSTTSKTMKVGDTFDLTATVVPANATDKEVEWTTSNTAVATVDANGKVTAKAVGSATITAKAKDGSNVSASCEVKVDPDNTALIVELTNIVSNVKNAYNSLKNLSSDMDKYLEGRIKVGETKKYEELALQEIDAAFNAYMSKAENFIDQLNNNHVATNEELEWFKKISSAFTKNEVLEYFKYYALKAEITAEGNGKVEFCGNDVRNETKKFVYYYPKVYTGVEILCSCLDVISHNPMIFFKENACTSMDNSTYCFDVTHGMRDPETYDKDIQIPVEYDNEKIKVVFHDNTAIITELENALNSTKSEYEKTANLSKDMEQFLDGCIRTSGMKDAENAAMQDVKVAYEAICKNVNDYIDQLNNHHNATDNEVKKYRALAKALSYEYILDFFKEYTLKATIKAEGNGKVEFCGNVVRNETKTFAFYYPKAYAEVESLCYNAGVSCNNPINFFNEKAAVAQDDATYCFDVVKDNGTPVTYEKNTEIGISDPINIIVTFNDYSTGIRGINAHDEDVKVYDISGRQVKAKRGINIVVDKNGNRRKVVIK